MKRSIIHISIFLLFSLFAESPVVAAVTPTGIGESIVFNESLTFEERLKELKSVDRSGLTHSERKQLRKEIRYVNNQIDGPKEGGGLLIAIAPLVVVVVLLILFL